MRISPLEGSGVKHTDVKINEMTRTSATILLLATGLMAADKDNWQRTKDCTAQAEKFARDQKGELIQDHYSPKYERCYVELAYFEPRDDARYELLDPFEHDSLAAMWLHPRPDEKKAPCRVSDGSTNSTNCIDYGNYVWEHLNN